MRNRNLKRALGLLLSLALLMCVSFAASAEEGKTETHSYNFDDGMQGWTTLDADGDGHDWVLLSAFPDIYKYYADLDLSDWAYGAQGNSVLSASYINNVGPLNPDNYLISPQVNLGGSISFYVKGVDKNYCKDHLAVCVSTTGTNANDFTVVHEWTIQDGEWNQIDVDLSEYSGMGYVAIRHFNIYDMYIVSIDNITITEQPVVHVHDFAFTAEGDTITATCTASGCDLEVNPTLTIVAPQKQVYGDDLSELATLEGLDDFNEITGLEVSEDDIRYFDAAKGGETELDSAPTDAGSYEARITVLEGEDAVTAVVEYEIEKADPELTPPEAKELTYNGEDQELVTAGESEDGTFEYALAGKDETPAEDDFSSELPTGKDAGTYYVYYRFIPDKNHKDAELAEPIEVTIAPAVLKITADGQEKTQGDPDPKLTYKAEGLIGGDAITGELAREEGEEPGKYAITIGTLDAGSNYEIEFTGTVLCINEPVPFTGDSFNPALYILLMIGAMAAALVLLKRSKI